MEHANENRISRATGWFMIVVALLFDLAQAASKIFLVLGLVVVGTLGGASIGSKVGLTETGAFIGGIVGAIAEATGIGAAAGAAVGFALNIAFSWAVAILGYATLGLWFAMKRVSVFAGRNITRKVVTLFGTFLIDIAPFLNVLPGLTVWTVLMIRTSRSEDKARRRRAAAVYNRSTAHPVRKHPPAANDNAPVTTHDTRRDEQAYADAA